MGRRSDIDWERIERLYIAGQLTLRQIADECDVNVASITKRAKKAGWQRNLETAIKERTKAKVSAIDVSALVEQSAVESARKSAQTIKTAIEQASDVAAGIVLKHRATAKLGHERAAAIEALLDEEMGKAEGVRDIATVASAFKALVEARGKLIAIERQSFGLEDGSVPADEKTSEIKVTFVGAAK